MNVYTVEFAGFYPVGAVALVIAENIKMAKILLEEKLEKMGLKQEIKIEDIKQQDTTTRRVDILLDGDY